MPNRRSPASSRSLRPRPAAAFPPPRSFGRRVVLPRLMKAASVEPASRLTRSLTFFTPRGARRCLHTRAFVERRKRQSNDCRACRPLHKPQAQLRQPFDLGPTGYWPSPTKAGASLHVLAPSAWSVCDDVGVTVEGWLSKHILLFSGLESVTRRVINSEQVQYQIRESKQYQPSVRVLVGVVAMFSAVEMEGDVVRRSVSRVCGNCTPCLHFLTVARWGRSISSLSRCARGGA